MSSLTGLVDLAEYIFQSDLHGYEFNRKLSFNDFMKPLGMLGDLSCLPFPDSVSESSAHCEVGRLLLSLRGGNDVKLKDIIDLRKYMNSHTNMSNSHIAKIDAGLQFACRDCLS